MTGISSLYAFKFLSWLLFKERWQTVIIIVITNVNFLDNVSSNKILLSVLSWFIMFLKFIEQQSEMNIEY